jgi:pimeloyl-ACP methyl ester carboxylesterase
VLSRCRLRPGPGPCAARARIAANASVTLWTLREGTGGPAAVFLPGGGSLGLDFLLVHERVARRTTSVLYDRASTGWSDDVDLPRPADAVVDELRALLAAMGVPAPYLLVGHSLGGLYAQRYAQRFPGEVARCSCSSPPTRTGTAISPSTFGWPRTARPTSRRRSRPRRCWTTSAPRSRACWGLPGRRPRCGDRARVEDLLAQVSR